VPAEDGKNWCAAVAAVKTMHMEPYRSMTLYELKDALIQQYGDRRQRNGATSGNGYYTDPSRPGCM